ncbi:MAG: lamin tail domain-containing protein [Verrucomicrobiota bacterium]
MNSLPHDSATIRLRNRADAVLLEVQYSGEAPWPAAADGGGHSLVLTRPSHGEGDPWAWSASAWMGGSPGGPDPSSDEPLASIKINELSVRAEEPELNFIELFNSGMQTIDLSGCGLSDEPATNKFVVPAGTLLSPRGFAVFHLAQLGFASSATAKNFYLRNATGTRVLDAVRCRTHAKGQSCGRYPDGTPGFHELVSKTPGAFNAGSLVREIVINEIMYSPASGASDDEYVELFNKGSVPASLARWTLSGGIDLTFPADTVLPAGGYLVAAKNAARLMTNYPNLNPSNTVGNFKGSLSNRGERLTLAMPEDEITIDNNQQFVTNTVYVVVDEVDYGTGGRWGKWADCGGSSLELKDPRSNHQLAANWTDSDEIAKSVWTNVQFTGVLDNGVGSTDSLQVLLQGAGECLIDNVEVLDSGDANRVANATFDSGLAGWTVQGNHDSSTFAASGGINNTSCLHIRAVGRGDTGANRIQTALTSPLTPGTIATIRAQVRWLRGHPEILLRLRGNYLEAVGELDVPKTLGTPGARNSQAVANAGPAIFDMRHDPILPAGNQSVVVTAQLDDPDGVASAILNYRIDPSATLASIDMVDDGTRGDAVAGDGIYSATIPGQSAGKLVAFHVRAKDSFSIQATENFPADAPARECLIRFGEMRPAGNFGTYRFWMTQATFARWNSRSKLDNTPYDVTFVYNDQRVIYNAGAYFAGSPYISPGYSTPNGNLCGYTVLLPDDDRFLGDTDVVLDWPGRDTTAIQEQMAYWIADQLNLPNNYRRFIHLHVNGVTEQQRGSIYEDVQQPGSDIINEWIPDYPSGDFYKIERWFEFSNSLARIADPEPTLENFTTAGGAKKLARYRWNWLKRAAKGTVNDYTNIFDLVDAANAPGPEPYTTRLESLVDIEQWMGIFAVEHIVNNFDSYGHAIGKNMYAYKSDQGKWQLFMFDIDWVMTASLAAGYDPTASLYTSNDPIIGRMYNHPSFRRAYLRTVEEAVNGPLVSATINPVMDAKYAALLANGVTRSSGGNLAPPATVKSFIVLRRNYLAQQLANVAASFSITSTNATGFSTDRNPVTLAGSAPIGVQTIRVNGVTQAATWTTVTGWSMDYPLKPGANVLNVEGVNRYGDLLPNATANITVIFMGTNQPAQFNSILINEWMASNAKTLADPLDGKFDDWFELYNPGAAPVDLGGYTLSDAPIKAARFLVPQGTVIPSRGYLMVWADDETSQNRPGADLHVNFKLNQNGESIALFAPDGQLVDSVTFGPQMSDVSEGRWPDGSPAPFQFMSSPSPNAANIISSGGSSEIRILSVTAGEDGAVTLSWTAQAGKHYRVQFKNGLTERLWQDLADEVIATGTTASVQDKGSSATRERYYRLRLLD